MKPARTVTRKRSFATQYHDGKPETAVVFRSGWADGAWCVILKDDTIAHCTDKWMAEAILACLMKSAGKEAK